jgi:hypothetical protein
MPGVVPTAAAGVVSAAAAGVVLAATTSVEAGIRVQVQVASKDQFNEGQDSEGTIPLVELVVMAVAVGGLEPAEVCPGQRDVALALAAAAVLDTLRRIEVLVGIGPTACRGPKGKILVNLVITVKV